MPENEKGAAPVKSGSRRETPTNYPQLNTEREGHDEAVCRLSRRRDRIDRVRFSLTVAGDGAGMEPDYIKRARRRRWAS